MPHNSAIFCPILMKLHIRVQETASYTFLVSGMFQWIGIIGLYVAGGLTADPDKCTIISEGEAKDAVAYRTSHVEADDRMMFRIHQRYKKYTINNPYIKDSLSISGADPCSTLGGIIPHFYRFFGILKFWGDIQVLPIFQVLTILKIWGCIQVLTKMYLNN